MSMNSQAFARLGKQCTKKKRTTTTYQFFLVDSTSESTIVCTIWQKKEQWPLGQYLARMCFSPT